MLISIIIKMSRNFSIRSKYCPLLENYYGILFKTFYIHISNFTRVIVYNAFIRYRITN